MTGPGIEPWAVHTLRCVDVPGAHNALRQAARGDDEEAPDVWGPDHWRDAVAVFPRVDALPAVLQAAHEAAPHLRVQ
eukprot:2820875-Lingulodinium_polyedra.AAC.1